MRSLLVILTILAVNAIFLSPGFSQQQAKGFEELKSVAEKYKLDELYSKDCDRYNLTLDNLLSSKDSTEKQAAAISVILTAKPTKGESACIYRNQNVTTTVASNIFESLSFDPHNKKNLSGADQLIIPVTIALKHIHGPLWIDKMAGTGRTAFMFYAIQKNIICTPNNLKETQELDDALQSEIFVELFRKRITPESKQDICWEGGGWSASKACQWSWRLDAIADEAIESKKFLAPHDFRYELRYLMNSGHIGDKLNNILFYSLKNKISTESPETNVALQKAMIKGFIESCSQAFPDQSDAMRTEANEWARNLKVEKFN